MACSPALASGSALAEIETPLSLTVKSSGPGTAAVFGIVRSDASATSAVTYTLGGESAGLIELAISDRAGDVLGNPLFCFDFATPPQPTPVRLAVQSMGGGIAVPNIGLNAAVTYDPVAGEIAVTMPPSAQCFFYGVEPDVPQFGLFGVAPTEQSGPGGDPDDLVFANRFEAEMGVSIAFLNVSPGPLLGYTIEVVNTGQTTLSSLAFQEVFPTSDALYPVGLGPGAWSCTNVSGSSSGAGPVRFTGQQLGPGQSISCTVSRDLSGSGTIKLHAGAVSGAGPNAAFDVAVAEVPVQAPAP